MADMTGHYAGERANRNGIAARCSHSRPVGFFEMSEKQNARLSDEFEFFDKIGKLVIVKRRVFGIDVLLETFDRRFVAARNTQSAIAEHSLAVDQMPD